MVPGSKPPSSLVLAGFFSTGFGTPTAAAIRSNAPSGIRLGLVDSFIVTRVAPKFDAAGNHTGTDFWLLWKAVGYDQGARHRHTVKVVRWWQDDVYMIDFVDTYDRHHHAEYPMEQTEPNEIRDLKIWHDYKKANAAHFAEIDAGVLEEHIRIAEEWK